MDNVQYVGLSKQMTLRHELDVVANNVANIDTVGFKVESLTTQADPQSLPAQDSGPRLVNFVIDTGVVRDFGQGALKETGSPLQLALQGRGFFRINTAAGERYTRDGQFSLDAQGRIVTADGDPVQGDGGDITLDQKKGAPHIAEDGTVTQQGQQVGKVAVVDFASLSALAKDSGNLYRNVSNLQPTPAAATTHVRQGMVEASNVEPITQITRLIEVQRTYESIAKIMSDTSDLSSKSIDKLGSLN